LQVVGGDRVELRRARPVISERRWLVGVVQHGCCPLGHGGPLLKLVDLERVAGLARKHGVWTVADNTFASPYVQRPLEYGFDLVIHSTTKYLNGHSDMVGGVAVVGTNDELRARMTFLQNAVGAIQGPFDSFLALRGLKTLALRMARHCASALTIAQWLERHPKVRRVHYPGLASHPQHALAKRQMRAFGGMISAELAGSLDDARRHDPQIRRAIRVTPELDRLVAAFAPFAARGVPIVGLEPSCLLTLRDELLSLRSDETAKNISAHALMFEEFLVREASSGRLQLSLGPIAPKALAHGHCHQKSFGAFKAVEQALRLIPDLKVETIDSSCCGMAGAFGYAADTYEASMEMAELSLLPAVRRADAETLVIADGTSCRHQIRDGTDRPALHVARALAMSLDSAGSNLQNLKT